ncbi:MAG TPA: hypothetical protein VF446_06330 [Trinickia sp.]
MSRFNVKNEPIPAAVEPILDLVAEAIAALPHCTIFAVTASRAGTAAKKYIKNGVKLVE